MTTVAQPASISNGSHAQESHQHTEHGPPRFTAVNGKETALHNPTIPPAAVNSNQVRETTDFVGINGNANSSRLEESQRKTSNAGTEDDLDSQESSSQTTPGGTNKNKRKRSESIERQSSQQDHLRLGGDIPGMIPSRSEINPELSMQPEVANGVKLLPTSVDYSGQPSTGYLHTEAKEDQSMNSTSSSWPDYDSHLISQAQKAQNLDTSDAQLVEALQRETHSTDSIEQKSWITGQASVSGESDQRSTQPYTPQEKSQAAVQVGPKRKRVFSNRTKTGCLTCRRRKKKCDEQHPACNNCIRGGFVCEGYSSRSTWQKPSSSKAPIPLQSKEGFSDAANHYLQDVGSSRHHERVSTTTQQSEVSKVRPVVVDDNDGSGVQYLGNGASVGGNRNAWPKRSWPGASSHPPYLSEHMAKPDYREVPPIHELSREGQPKAEYHVVPSIRELSQQGSHAKPGMPIFQSNVDQRPAHPTTMDTNSPQAQARLALSIEHQLSARHNAGEDTERDKMIHGELYRPFDIQLVEDRDRCKSALWRFNNACNPQSGVSSKEQNRLLREIIIPPAANAPSGSPLRPSGSIGQGAVVEAPFRCHYGFNINIGEDVMISENCSMVDDCPINIGAHTWIGPNVTILGSMAHANMQERKGSQSRYQGRSVTIEEDCYVGANCTIYPGVRLRRGAYVAPGEVVKSDIVAYGFQGLKPSYM